MTTTTTKRQNDDEMIDMALATAAKFGETFGLRAFPGDVFRVSPVRFKHFVSEGEVQLVVEVKRTAADAARYVANPSPEGEWLDMGRNTVEAIAREVIITAKPEPAATVIEGEANIRGFQALAVRAAMQLELKGMTHSGGSVIARWRKHLGLKGNRQKVYEQFCALHGLDVRIGRPTPEQLAALRAYAAEHGRTWKADLRADWMTACAHVREDLAGYLQQLRNTLGPSWLATFRLDGEVRS